MQLNLDFEDNRAGDMVAQVGRYTVTIKRELYSTESPWDWWDGLAPYVSAGDRQGDKPTYSRDFPNPVDLYSGIDRERMKKVCRSIAAMLADEVDSSYTPAQLYREARESLGYYHAADMADSMHDIAESLLYSRNPLPLWAAAFAAMDWPYLDTCSTGYSQGDYIDILFVIPPREQTKWGIPEGKESDALEHARKLFGYWAWGDVYGYVIEDSEGEHIDSCWGFYTDSPDTDEESGLLESIRENMPHDWHVDSDIGAAAMYGVA